MTLYTVPGTGFGQLIINSGDGPTMVINRDETVQLYIGDDNSVASKSGTGDIDIIDPLSYIVYSGVDSKYAIAATPGAEIQVDCVKGATNWAPSPAQAAQQIAALGLATASNQTTQIGHEANTETNTSTAASQLTAGIGGTSLAKTSDIGLISSQSQWKTTSGLAVESGGNLASTATNTGATKTSVDSVKTTLGTPAQTADVTGISSQVGWPASGLAKETGGNLASAASQLVSGIGGTALAKTTDVTGISGQGGWVSSGLAKDASVGLISAQSGWPTSGLAKESGGNLATASGALAGTATSALLGVSGNTIGKEIAAWLAGGAVSSTPGGVPILHGFSSFSAPQQSIPANSSVTLNSPTGGFTAPSYFIQLAPVTTTNVGVTNPFIQVTMKWCIDSGYTTIIAREDWIIPVGQVAAFVATFGKGPVKGPYLQIVFANLDPSVSMTLNWALAQSSHPIARDDWRGNGASIFGVPAANGVLAFGNILAAFNSVSIPGSASNQYILPLYAGAAWLTANSSLANINISVQSTIHNAIVHQEISVPLTTASAQEQLVMLPREVCYLNVKNTNAGANLFTCAIIAQEYAS